MFGAVLAVAELPAAAFRPTAKILAPEPANTLQQARPMPDVAPVTRHTKPSQRKAMKP